MEPVFEPGEIRIALRLIGIGRPWGHVPGEVPSERDARIFLDFAFQAGIRYFDTAPSYGSSEERLGGFLRSLSPDERASLSVATKFGEHWNAAAGQPFVDHSHAALARSLDRSLELLGEVDVLQLHKTTPDVLRSDDLERAWDRARALGIPQLGVSVSDAESAAIGHTSRRYQMMQFPLNSGDLRFAQTVRDIQSEDMWAAINRPFGMGKLIAHASQPGARRVEAFRFVISMGFRGVVLSGTKSAEHLAENLAAFDEAIAGRN